MSAKNEILPGQTQLDAKKNKRAFSQLYEKLTRENHQQSKTDNLNAKEAGNFKILFSAVDEKLAQKIEVFLKHQNYQK